MRHHRFQKLKLERLLDNLTKKLDRLYPESSSRNMSVLGYWKDKPVISLDEWIRFRDAPYALDYFPDDFDQSMTYMPQDESEKGQERQKDIEKWNSDFIELMEYIKNPNYGKLKCFHCLLSPAGDDPIFIGINRLVSKGLIDKEQGEHIQYPCHIVNRFQCPYERVPNVKDQQFDTHDLFALQKMAFAVEISLAKARKKDSKIRIRNKEELFHALTNEESLAKILEQGSEAPEAGEYFRTYLADNRDDIIDQFMKVKNKVNREELRFY